jgi:VWFA-related protein
MPPIKTVPEGSVPPDNNTGTRDDLYRLAVNVNFVQVPVTVKNFQGQLVAGLLPNDFVVLEDGKKQQLRFFSSDPFPLSAALILDLGMPDAAVQKINTTFPALEGAFSQFDQVSLYSYSDTVSQLTGFTAVNQKLTEALNQAKNYHGSNNGPPVTSGPLAGNTPNVNGHPVDTPVQPVVTPPKTARVLNDALLRAALDLSKQDKTRRKIIFIISDGREFGSTASYKDVLKVLLTNNIIVYGIGVEAAALPVYGKLQRLAHLPRYGYSDILPKYANATGGEVYNELSSSDIDQAYAAAMGEARNQYTLGYTTRLTPSSAYREIEVRVRRADVKVYAKAGYYPLPPGR